MDNNSQTRFASISMQGSDKIRLLKFNSAEISAIKNVIQRSWHKPIQATRTISFSQEFKLAGRPWQCVTSSDDATASRVLVRDLLADLFSRGWILSLPTVNSITDQESDAMIFRKLLQPAAESEWLVIFFPGWYHLRLIGAPLDLIAGIQAILKNLRLLEGEKWENRSKNSYNFKLQGSPWKPGDEESVATRMLVVMLLETLERFGWSLYTSLQHNRLETTDNWYCVRRVDWVPGMPVFHR